MLVDGPNLLWRLFYARNAWQPVSEAVSNAVQAMSGQVKALAKAHRATHLVVLFDGGDGGRKELLPSYKADRTKPEGAEDMVMRSTQHLTKSGIRNIICDGYEAEDAIASYVARVSILDGWEVIIVSTDKDLMQLVGGPVHLWNLATRTMMVDTDVWAKFGVPPCSIRDYLALRGDSCDGIPGAPGVGHKTALRLLDRFGSVDNVLARSSDIPGKLGERIASHRKQIELSYELVRLRDDFPVDVASTEIFSA